MVRAPVCQYKANLRAIVQLLKARCPQAAVTLISPPPVDEAQWTAGVVKTTGGRLNGRERSAARAKEYTAAAAEEAKAAGCAFLSTCMQREAPSSRVAGAEAPS